MQSTNRGETVTQTTLPYPLKEMHGSKPTGYIVFFRFVPTALTILFPFFVVIHSNGSHARYNTYVWFRLRMTYTYTCFTLYTRHSCTVSHCCTGCQPVLISRFVPRERRPHMTVPTMVVKMADRAFSENIVSTNAKLEANPVT